jgi:hypothetical protein
LKDWSSDSKDDEMVVNSNHDDPVVDAAAPRQPAASTGVKWKAASKQPGASGWLGREQPAKRMACPASADSPP